MGRFGELQYMEGVNVSLASTQPHPFDSTLSCNWDMGGCRYKTTAQNQLKAQLFKWEGKVALSRRRLAASE